MKRSKPPSEAMGGECKRARFSSSRLSGIALREEFFQEQDALLPGHVSSVLRAALLPAGVARAPEWLDAPVARAQQLVFVRVRGVEPQALASEHAAAEDGSTPLPFLSSMAAIKTLLREPRFSCSTTLHDAADLILAPIRGTAPCCNRGAPSRRRARPRARALPPLAPRLTLPCCHFRHPPRLTPNPAPPGLPTRADLPFAAVGPYDVLYEAAHPRWRDVLLLKRSAAQGPLHASVQRGDCVRGSGLCGTWVLELAQGGGGGGDSSAEEGELSEEDGPLDNSGVWGTAQHVRLTLHWGGRFPAETVHSIDGGRVFEAQVPSGAFTLHFLDALQPPTAGCNRSSYPAAAPEGVAADVRVPLLSDADTLRGALEFVLPDAELVELRFPHFGAAGCAPLPARFVRSVRRVGASAGSATHAVLGLDCEMCETASGSVCARVTLVSAALDTVYDSLVLPPEPITDYVTQFSGITAEIMKSATKDLAAVQAELLELVHADTILVGHSLDNDLRSLHFEHRKVVDTAALYPDARGRPYRRSLKLLVSQHFGATIQDGEHDSAIDAICSLRLLQVRPASSSAATRTQRARNAPCCD